MNRFHRLLPILLLLALGALAAEKRLWARSVLGEKGPALVVERWLTAPPDTRGKFVLVDFWATWCGPCRRAVAELNTFHATYGDRLAVIGLSDEEPEVVAKFASPKPAYALAVDREARMKKALEVKGIPHLLLLDPDGIVRWEGFPFLEGHELTAQVLEDLFARYGKGAAPAPGAGEKEGPP